MGEQLRALYADGRALIDAELDFQKKRVARIGRTARAVALLAVAGLMLLGLSAGALVIGALIALIPALGPWGAMTTVVLATFALALLVFGLALAKVNAIGALIRADPETLAAPARPEPEPEPVRREKPAGAAPKGAKSDPLHETAS